jgi:molybdopterin/thiamine biosynthesis adenylyltransferase
MQLQVINLNDDLKKLENESYSLEVRGSHLLVHDIPYVNSKKEIKYGTIVTVLNFKDATSVDCTKDHTVHFCGEAPCDDAGQILSNIINSSVDLEITPEIKVNHYFSYKPPKGYYNDYYEKISAYTHVLSSYARLINPLVSHKTGKNAVLNSGSDVFKYPDTNSARARIDKENAKFHNLKIGIIGVGGTGSYILDLVSKTQVREIHIYDDDVLQIHNIFRSPGTVPDEIINIMKDLKKVDYYNSVYSRMHLGIKAHPYRINIENISELHDLDYVFVCVDNCEVRYTIITELVKMGLAFLDVGLGVVKRENGLLGTIRVTSADKNNYAHLWDVIGPNELEENEYNSNIQIADLNCLNAALAVIKWKKHVSFYVDLKGEHHSLYHFETNKIINDFTS